MKNFVLIPNCEIYKGYVVDDKTTLEYVNKNKTIRQELKNLEFIQYEKKDTSEYSIETKTTIHLKKGMVVLFENEERGYVVPVDRYVTIKEAIQELDYIKDLDTEVANDIKGNEGKNVKTDRRNKS